MVVFESDREPVPAGDEKCGDLQQVIDRVIPKCDAVAVRSYVTRELAISLIDAFREGKQMEALFGLLPPENGATDTATWLNYNTLMKMKAHHVGAYRWFINAITEEYEHQVWGLNSPVE